jgi:hydrogenase maturation protease
MEADEADVTAGIADGDMIDPHAMDPESVLRFVKAVGGWPGKVIVIACEPDEVEEVGIGLSGPIAASVDRASELVLETIAGLRGDRPLEVG